MATSTRTLEPDTRQEIEILEALDFDPEISCEFPFCAELHGAPLPAELVVSLTCHGCPRTVRLLCCEPCWETVQQQDVMMCQICRRHEPIGRCLKLIGRLR